METEEGAAMRMPVSGRGAGARRACLALVAASAALGCTHTGPRPGDGQAAALEEVLRLDAEWSRTLAARDPGAFEATVAEDALFAGRGGLIRGRAGVRATWGRWFEPGAPRFAWAPDGGGASASGDLAWSTGGFRIDATDDRGRPSPIEGRYVTVWRRDADGRWRALLDGPGVPASALGPGLGRAPARTVVSRSGDLEADIGTWTRGGDGPRHGVYITIRRKGADGTWTTPVDSAIPTAQPPTP